MHIHYSLKTYEQMKYKHWEYSSKNIILDVIHVALMVHYYDLITSNKILTN